MNALDSADLQQLILGQNTGQNAAGMFDNLDLSQLSEQDNNYVQTLIGMLKYTL